MELSLSAALILCLTGFIAGGINTVAGGGSNLTLPVLMMLGLPADIANGTNRISILLQSLVSTAGYDRHQTLDRPAIVPVLIPTVSGGIIGAVAAGESQRAWWGLFGAGLYGGFVQAAVGFILLAALAGGLRYDLLRANALKTVCVLAFTSVALVIFIIFDQVWWVPGLVLAAGSMAGAHLAVKVAVRASASTIKWFLFLMTVCAVLASLLF